MLVSNATSFASACRWCGAYGNSQHRPTCQPGRIVPIGSMRRARRDSRNSAAALARHQKELWLCRDL